MALKQVDDNILRYSDELPYLKPDLCSVLCSSREDRYYMDIDYTLPVRVGRIELERVELCGHGFVDEYSTVRVVVMQATWWCWCKLDFASRTSRKVANILVGIVPEGVEGSFAIHALKGVSTKKVAKALDQVGRDTGPTVLIVVSQGG